MTNQEVKNELIAAIFKLMPYNKVAAEIAFRSGYSPQYVNVWMNKNLIHPEIEAKAFELLEELKTDAASKLETIKTA